MSFSFPFLITSGQHDDLTFFFFFFWWGKNRILFKNEKVATLWCTRNGRIGMQTVISIMGGTCSAENTYLFIRPVTSLSSISISIFIGITVVFALISFFSFSHSVRKRNVALGLLLQSILYFSLNSSLKWSTRTKSKSLPPNSLSEAVART